MLNTSTLYKKLIKDSGRTFRAKILVTFADNSTAELTDKDIMQGSLVIKKSTSDEGSFTVGSAVIGELDFEIDNSSGTYDNMSFEGAVFDVRIGLVTKQKYDGTFTIEWLRKGIYTAEEITVNEKYISIVAYDDIAKLDVPFANAGIHFPCSLVGLYGYICTYCGISYASPDFANSGYIVSTGEYIDADASCREVMSYIAQMARAFVSCDNTGTLHLRWYEEAVLGYDEAHNKIFYQINERQKINGNVQISGVRHILPDETETLIGTDRYCIVIEDNPLALDSSFLEHDVWTNRRTGGLIGMKLTPFSSSVISDPAVEVGDMIKISDLNGRIYTTPITNIIFSLDAKMTVSCDAETINEKNRTSANPSARIISRSKKNTAQQISQYDVRAKQFSQIAVNAMGFYQTDEVQSDGSTITYLHDKPLKADSTTIWKKSVDGFFVSNDGGQTYIAGIDSSGNAVLNILAVKGIVADWIKAGIISDAVGNVSIDMSNGNIVMNLNNRHSLKIWTNGITMYDENNAVLTSMFVSTQRKGVVTANHLLIGQRDHEKVSISTDNNGDGYIIINTTQIKETDNKLTISKTIKGNLEGNVSIVDSNNNEVGSFYLTSGGSSRLNVSLISLQDNGQEVGSFYIGPVGAVLKTSCILVNGEIYKPITVTIDGIDYKLLGKLA